MDPLTAFVICFCALCALGAVRSVFGPHNDVDAGDGSASDTHRIDVPGPHGCEERSR